MRRERGRAGGGGGEAERWVWSYSGPPTTFKALLVILEVSELYRELRETRRIRFLKVWSKSELMMPSYGTT